MINKKSATPNPSCDEPRRLFGMCRRAPRALLWLRFGATLGLICLLNPLAKASLDPTKDITQFIHQSWQSEQGLPENSVSAIAQTKDGYLWLGTEDPLGAKDGVRRHNTSNQTCVRRHLHPATPICGCVWRMP